MLWHQRLGHLNFRRLSELHKHTRGLPALSLPDVIDECAVCMASKLRKTPRGHTNTMTATTCLQGLGIDFAFMVQKSSDSKCFDNRVGHNGETCYVLITDHFSGRLIGRAFATKAPPRQLAQSKKNQTSILRVAASSKLERSTRTTKHTPCKSTSSILPIRTTVLALSAQNKTV